jgi:hypothetical protein
MFGDGIVHRLIEIIVVIIIIFTNFNGILSKIGIDEIFKKHEQPIITDETDIDPDTWTAVDGLDRTLPTYKEVGDKDDEKFVGMFYWIWHENFAKQYTAKNVQQILNEHPEAINDYNSSVWDQSGDGIPHFWNEPLFGYYTSVDEYVLRKHAEMIADAGVDVIVFDCTNGSQTFDESYEALFRVFEQAKQDGVNVPKIAFILPFAAGEDTKTSLVNLYDNIYSKGRYKDLWFMWKGKPLIMAYSESLNKKDAQQRKILNFFTFRENESSYFAKNTSICKKTWGWCSDYPQTKFGTSLCGKTEEMCVSVAQNAANGSLVAMNSESENVQGRSFTHGEYSYTYNKYGKSVTVDRNTEDSMYYGLNFQQQWDYAIKCTPEFIFVTGWNEWIAGRFKNWCGTNNAFPDECNDEYSRDIEPSAGELKDYYYYQLVSNIRKYKGVSKPAATTGNTTIDIYGSDSQWNNVKNQYNHYVNSTQKRDCHGWVGLQYQSDTMRNDFKSAKVTYDNNYVYFRIETVNDISPYTDNAWMRILIDSDSDNANGWEGFEYIINRNNATSSKVKVEAFNGGWIFNDVGSGDYYVNGNHMYLRIPRSALGIDENGSVHFNFKLSDNMQTDGDIMDFYKNGDVAPGGRFAFVF